MTDNSARTLDANWKRALRRRVLAWFDRHSRDLPWRRTRELYHVWVSEIMLQQTQVATVTAYFERFLERFPTIADLAAADEQDVLRSWEGLGYYRRARQLHGAARAIVAEYDGQFPRDVAAVRGLPGVGRYTAGAILSIGLDAREPILEANTVRLFSRLMAYVEDPLRSAGQRTLWQFATDILPRTRCGDFNQGLMELGSTICTPARPACDRCPLRGMCEARARGLVEQIPAGGKKTRYEDVREAAVVIRRGGRVLLRRCSADERWAGLWDFPRFPIAARRGPSLRRELAENVKRLTGLTIAPGQRLSTIRHGVTRFRITLLCHEATFVSGRTASGKGPMQWIAPAHLEKIPLSVSGRKISRLLVG